MDCIHYIKRMIAYGQAYENKIIRIIFQQNELPYLSCDKLIHKFISNYAYDIKKLIDRLGEYHGPLWKYKFTDDNDSYIRYVSRDFISEFSHSIDLLACEDHIGIWLKLYRTEDDDLQAIRKSLKNNFNQEQQYQFAIRYSHLKYSSKEKYGLLLNSIQSINIVTRLYIEEIIGE